MAYCMLGLFDVQMPLLYGEGDKAFLRLQMEIIRKSNDHTIFVWGFGGPHHVSPSQCWRSHPETSSTRDSSFCRPGWARLWVVYVWHNADRC